MKPFSIKEIKLAGFPASARKDGSAIDRINVSSLVIRQDLAEMEYRRLGKDVYQCKRDLAQAEKLGANVIWEQKKADSSVVYFIICREVSRIKIGTSKSLNARVERHSTACPFPLELLCSIPGGVQVEHQIHAKFAHLRRHLEWFEAAPELLSYIESLKQNETHSI